MGLELILATDLDKLPPIEFNFDVLKDGLNVKLERYRNLIIEDKDIKDAKADRAELNKLSAAIDGERKRIKKQYLEPYDKFEAQLKELLAMIEKPCTEIDAKVKDFESRQKKIKRDAIERFYIGNVKGLADKITLEKIYLPKWDTQAEKLINITQEMISIFERISTDVSTIKSMNLKFETTVLEKFFENLNLGEALKENVRLIAIDATAAEREAAIKVEKERQEAIKARETTASAINPVTYAAEIKPPAESVRPSQQAPIPPAEEKITVDMRVVGTQTQLEKLLSFLSENNIEYSEVPEREAA